MKAQGFLISVVLVAGCSRSSGPSEAHSCGSLSSTLDSFVANEKAITAQQAVDSAGASRRQNTVLLALQDELVHDVTGLSSSSELFQHVTDLSGIIYSAFVPPYSSRVDAQLDVKWIESRCNIT